MGNPNQYADGVRNILAQLFKNGSNSETDELLKGKRIMPAGETTLGRQGRIDAGMSNPVQRRPTYQGGDAGGAPGGYEGVGHLNTQDPATLLAERIGKLRGAMKFSSGSLMPSRSHRMIADMREQLGPLDSLAAQMGMGSGLAASTRKGKPGVKAKQMPRSQPQPRLEDPGYRMEERKEETNQYGDIPYDVLESAMRYLRQINPHLFSNL